MKKKECIQIIRKLLESKAELIEQVKETVQEIMQRVTGIDITCCPKCRTGATTFERPDYTGSRAFRRP